MSIHHHPDDSTLFIYAAGAVPEGFSLVLAAHLERCSHCRMRMAEAEDIGGNLLDALPSVELQRDCLDQVWARIEADSSPLVPSTAHIPAESEWPLVLTPYLPQGLGGVSWRTLAPGIRQHVFKDVESARGTVRLLYIAPGTTIPRHTHGGSELTLVLSGSYMDEIGRFQSGDLADLDDSVSHQPVADTDQPCICLIATDERLRFSGVLGRMLQPFLGI
jgi:putative transcriptional regulator